MSHASSACDDGLCIKSYSHLTIFKSSQILLLCSPRLMFDKDLVCVNERLVE